MRRETKVEEEHYSITQALVEAFMPRSIRFECV